MSLLGGWHQCPTRCLGESGHGLLLLLRLFLDLPFDFHLGGVLFPAGHGGTKAQFPRYDPCLIIPLTDGSLSLVRVLMRRVVTHPLFHQADLMALVVKDVRRTR